MLVMIALIGLMLEQFSSVQSEIKQLRDKVSPQVRASERLAFDVVQVQQFLTDVSATHELEGYTDAQTFADDFKTTVTTLRRILTFDQDQELKSIELAFADFYLLGQQMAETYVADGTEAGNAKMEPFDAASLVLTERVNKFRDAAVNYEQSSTERLVQGSMEAQNIVVAIGCMAVVISLLISLYLTRHLSKQLGIDPFYAKAIAKEISEGNLERDIKVATNDKTSLLYAMKVMQQQILGRMTTANKLIDEITRIKIALDNVSTSVMIIDNDRNIIYVNYATVSLLAKVETDIQRDIPGFSVRALVGSNIDSFHKNPKHQADLIANAKGIFKSSLVLHGHHFVITVSPVIDEQGRRLGSAAEWLDRTSEVSMEQEMSSIMATAVMGDLSRRFDIRELEGFYREIGEGLNQLLHTCEVSLDDVVRVLDAIAHGDLTETISREYTGTFGRLKNNTNATAARLKEIIGQIRDASDNINSDAKEIASGNNDLSHRTEVQSASLEEMAASMQQLTSTVTYNAENARRANNSVLNAAEIANKGGTVVNQVITTMEEINASARKIVDIISVIDGIAFQTNILALNAAVEAARAGDQGRGFAVVATEVRNLAQRAAAAAGEIKNLIGDSVDKVEEGTRLVDRAGKTMIEIVDSIKDVTTMMASITSASEKQNTGIAQVNQALGQMDTVTQQNAALVEQATASAESLEEQVSNLAVIVGSFKVDSHGKITNVSKIDPVFDDGIATTAVDDWEEF